MDLITIFFVKILTTFRSLCEGKKEENKMDDDEFCDMYDL